VVAALAIAALGKGGPTIQAVTTNGPVAIRRN